MYCKQMCVGLNTKKSQFAMQSGAVTREQGHEHYVQDGHGIENGGKRKR